MLKSVIENYLKSVTEFNFFNVFRCLLERKGYSDIHFTHGNIEFGKDFICKKDNAQYVIQIKAKDIDINIFRREIKPQLLQALTERVSHPNLDDSMNYKVIFVNTGRLNSPTQISFTVFNKYVTERLEENTIECWDFDTLVQDIYTNAIAIDLLENADNIRVSNFFKKLSTIQSGIELDWFEIEDYTSQWLVNNDYNIIFNISIETFIFVQMLLNEHHYYSAFIFLLAYCRYLYLKEFYDESSEIVFLSIKDIVRKVKIDLSNEKNIRLIDIKKETIKLFEYPRNCCQYAEILAFGILNENIDVTIDELIDIILNETGVSYLISENYLATFFIIAITLIKNEKIEILEKYIINTTVFLCDAYEDLGLASFGSSISEEDEQLLSFYLEGFEHNISKSSSIASAILFIADKIFDENLYSIISNDIKACEIILQYTHVLENIGVFNYDDSSIFQSFDNDYKIEKSKNYSEPLINEIEKIINRY